MIVIIIMTVRDAVRLQSSATQSRDRDRKTGHSTGGTRYPDTGVIPTNLDMYPV